jgi:tetratricopeptide (TPR) repeat protein
MKKLMLSILGIWTLAFFSPLAIAQKQVSMPQGSMNWTTKSKEAKKFYATGLYHIINVEREQAYQDFKAAVTADPEFTLALSFLANLSAGETRKAFAKRAQASATNKSEGDVLFASLTDEKATAETRQQTWAKLHTLYPNDIAIGHFYVVSRATPEERLAAATEYNKKYPEEAAMYNMLGYYNMLDKKDNAKAKEYFEKYIQLYPDGANPYDSMGEFYLTIGDTASAEKYYTMALERFPFMVSSVQAIEKITAEKKKTEQGEKKQ